jgi:hypothetical protein
VVQESMPDAIVGGCSFECGRCRGLFCCRVAARLARWTVIGVIFYHARLVIRWSSVQSVACQAVKHAITVCSCDDCAKLSCKACLYDRGGSTCDECSKALCEKCVHDG